MVFQNRSNVDRSLDHGLEPIALVRLEPLHRFGDISLSLLGLLALLGREIVVGHGQEGPNLVERYGRVFAPRRCAELEEARPPAEFIEKRPELLHKWLRGGLLCQRSQLLVRRSIRQGEQLVAGFRDRFS